MKKIISILTVIIFTIFIVLCASNIVETNAAEVFPFDGIIHADALGIHKTPDYNSSSEITQLAYGTKVTVIGASGSLYKIVYDTDKEGYASKNYIINLNTNTAFKDISGIETYATYCDSLQKQGFPDSYCPYLYYLHYKHPTWIFKADNINYSLEEVSTKEVEKVSLQTKNPNYFHYRNGEPLINEKSSGGDYYYINADTISSFMDPRNSLFELTIFQFLNLEKNTEAVNDAALKSIVGNGNLKNYFNEFKTAANTLEINALHLIARSSQEGANSSTYDPVTGKYTTLTKLTNPDGRTLDGFYNFYNIGSYNETGYKNPVHRGIAYAAGYIEGTSYNRPWNTPEKAILGGGEYIGNGYVKKGQNTNYFQKFNVSSYTRYPTFNHQYMTNAYAPKAEGESIKKAYVAGDLIETNFEFVIPVYKNMGNNPYQPVDKNSDTTLSSLKINNNMITGFTNTRTEYMGINIVTESDTFTLSVIPNSSLSKISSEDITFEDGTATINFVEGVANIKFQVNAENETSTEYTIEVKKILPINNVTVDTIVSKMGVKVNSSFMYGISPGTTMEGLINTIKKNNGSATIVDKDGKTKKENILVTGDKITIKGTLDSKAYIVAVRGDINGDGAVKINDLILLQSHILDKAKLTKEKLYAADINYDSNLKINDLILIQSHILGKASL